MGHTASDDLKDLRAELTEIASWEGVRQKSPGIFYFKSTPFLHFHDKDGVRWADVRDGKGWKKLEIDFAAPARERAAFLKGALRAYQVLRG